MGRFCEFCKPLQFEYLLLSKDFLPLVVRVMETLLFWAFAVPNPNQKNQQFDNFQPVKIRDYTYFHRNKVFPYLNTISIYFYFIVHKPCFPMNLRQIVLKYSGVSKSSNTRGKKKRARKSKHRNKAKKKTRKML